jgi:hypothetical protein
LRKKRLAVKQPISSGRSKSSRTLIGCKPAILPLGGPLMVVRPNQASWQQGYQDGFAGEPLRPIKMPDELACASGLIEGRAARETTGVASRVTRPRLRIRRKS